MKISTIFMIIIVACTLAACGGSNFEWFPDPLDATKPTVSVTIAGQSVFTNNSTNTTSATASVSSLPASLVFSANEPANVYYTLNGADPTTASTSVDIPVAGGQIAGPDITANNTTLKFFGIDKSDQKNKSAIQSILVKSTDVTPAVITTMIGTVAMINNGITSVSTLPAQVVFSSNEAALVYYTIDGSEPTVNSPSEEIPSAQASVNGPEIAVTGTTLKYFSKDRSSNSSSVQTTTVTADSPNDPTAPSVWLLVSGQTYVNDSTIVASINPAPVSFIASEPVTVYYTTNGSEPNTSSPSIPIGNSHQAAGPTISLTNTLLWYFGIDFDNKQSPKIKSIFILP